MKVTRRKFIFAVMFTTVSTKVFATFASYQNATNLNFLLLESGDNLSLQNGELLVDP